MNKLIIFTCSFILAFSVFAETVYKTTNPDGSVSFTDRETKNSEKIEVQKTQTVPAQRFSNTVNLPVKKLSPQTEYAITIKQPLNDSTILDSHDVAVTISVEPVISAGSTNKIRYQLGGQTIENQSMVVVFKNVARGSHNLIVSIINANGEQIGSPVTHIIHMKRFFKKPAAKP